MIVLFGASGGRSSKYSLPSECTFQVRALTCLATSIWSLESPPASIPDVKPPVVVEINPMSSTTCEIVWREADQIACKQLTYEFELVDPSRGVDMVELREIECDLYEESADERTAASRPPSIRRRVVEFGDFGDSVSNERSLAVHERSLAVRMRVKSATLSQAHIIKEIERRGGDPTIMSGYSKRAPEEGVVSLLTLSHFQAVPPTFEGRWQTIRCPIFFDGELG